jgi:phosphate transport system protein
MHEGRLHFGDELRELEQQALGALDFVVGAIENVSLAIERADIPLAQQVMADDDRIDGRYLEVHQSILSLLARQSPVATDLRIVAALLDVIRHAERMGDQCVNIAKFAPLGEPVPSGGEAMLSKVGEMGTVAAALVAQAKQAFAQRDLALAEDLVRRDDALDALNRQCFQLAIDCGDDPGGREWAMQMMLISRWLERIGDYAVDIGEEAAFVVTGEFREFSDASHPARANA